jgi:hypothetical protein
LLGCRAAQRIWRTVVDKDTADIAVAVYDLDRTAHSLPATADYQTLTNLIAADLQPHRITTRSQLNDGGEERARQNKPTRNPRNHRRFGNVTSTATVAAAQMPTAVTTGATRSPSPRSRAGDWGRRRHRQPRAAGRALRPARSARTTMLSGLTGRRGPTQAGGRPVAVGCSGLTRYRGTGLMLDR